MGTIFIAKLLGDTNYGLYGIALTAPTLIGLFRDWGVSTAMIRYTAQYNAENKAANIRRIFIAGLVFETVLGLALSLFTFQFPGILAIRPQPTHHSSLNPNSLLRCLNQRFVKHGPSRFHRPRKNGIQQYHIDMSSHHQKYSDSNSRNLRSKHVWSRSRLHHSSPNGRTNRHTAHVDTLQKSARTRRQKDWKFCTI